MSRFVISLAILLLIVNFPGNRGDGDCQDIIQEIDDINTELQDCECVKEEETVLGAEEETALEEMVLGAGEQWPSMDGEEQMRMTNAEEVYYSCADALAANPDGAGRAYLIMVDGVETFTTC